MGRNPKWIEDPGGLFGVNAAAEQAVDDGLAESDAKLSITQERARHEAIKATRAEFHHQIELGNYVPRDEFREALARTLSLFTQSVRSIPDNIERELGVEATVVEKIGFFLDDALETLANELEKLGDKSF